MLLARDERPDALNAVVLDFRNRKLAERIAVLPSKNIFVIYGRKDLPGLVQELQARNPFWRVMSTSWTTATLPPDDATGRLSVRAEPCPFGTCVRLSCA